MRRTSVGLLGAAMLVSAITACGGEDATHSWGSEEDYSVVGALRQLQPLEADGPVTIRTADLVAATESAGLKRPGDLDGAALEQWIGPLAGIPVATVGPAPVFVPVASIFNQPRLNDHQDFADELGWSVLDVEAFVEQSVPSHTFTVIAGNFDESSLASSLPEVEDGVVTAGDGEDFAVDLIAATVARPTGVPLRLTHKSGLIAAGPSTDTVASWAAGTDATLADDEALFAVAEALDGAGAISAMLVAGAPQAGAQFDTVGIGWAVNDGASVITVAYHFDSDDTANVAVGAFEQLFADDAPLFTGQRLSDFLVFNRAEQSDQVVVLTLAVPEGATPGVIANLLMSGDAPFIQQ